MCSNYADEVPAFCIVDSEFLVLTQKSCGVFHTMTGDFCFALVRVNLFHPTPRQPVILRFNLVLHETNQPPAIPTADSEGGRRGRAGAWVWAWGLGPSTTMTSRCIVRFVLIYLQALFTDTASREMQPEKRCAPAAVLNDA